MKLIPYPPGGRQTISAKIGGWFVLPFSWQEKGHSIAPLSF
jgi:hypothetical protein